MLKIYNTFSRKKQIFKPIKPGKVGMYVCGMTVYDYCHIGHGRIYVVFDMVTRYLRSCGYKVNYVVNITDIDDKIIKRANELSEDTQTLAQRFIDALHLDMTTLGVLFPDHEPRATQHIPQILALIRQLLVQELAYVTPSGDVYYHVAKFPDYGQLAHKNLDELQAGSRVEVAVDKHHPLDFALWKAGKPDEPTWDSPWGKGRPGWHIECSAMSTHCLGQPFDIHGGGLDLQFPHHENEIAQSEGALGKKFVNTWMHVGHVQINREKMSKSLGNFFTISEVLAKYEAEVVRYFMLASHYRSPINYSDANLDSAKAALARGYMTLRDLPVADEADISDYETRFHQAMEDDFNTPVALAVLFDLIREINKLRDENAINQAAGFAKGLKRLAAIFGLLQQDPQTFLQGKPGDQESDEIEALILARKQAREQKNWAEADRLRLQLDAMGVVLEDSVHGTVWRKE